MNVLKRALFILFAMVMFSVQGRADHVAGADIQYTCIGQDSFRVQLNLFRDCAGIQLPQFQNLNFISDCGGSTSAIAQQVSVQEVSQLCATQIDSSTCNGGALPGMQHFIFEVVVVLTPTCNSWTASWQSCCRNFGILNIANPSSAGMHIKTVMNTATANCNNSPAFNSQPIPYVCAFQTANYNFGVTEPDGDSLVYSLVPALTNTSSSASYLSPYSPTNPVVGLTLNSQTGQLTFTPVTLGNFIIVVQVDEYDPISGLLKGSTSRDIQVVVISCSNTVPTSTGATNFSGTGNLLDSNSIEVCYGQTFSFEVEFNDTDSIDSLSIASNIAQVLPGASFNIVQNTNTNPKAQVSWTAQAGTPSFNVFNMSASDGACPIPGIISVTFDITVLPSVYAGEDAGICINTAQTAQLSGAGAPTLHWSVISGPPMVVGTGPGANFSCNPCDNPVATPVATTVYQLTGNGYNGPCDSLDTITVFLAPNFQLIMPNDTLICEVDEVTLLTNATPFNTNINWSWNNGASLDDDTLLSPLASPSVTTTYTLTATSNAGCTKQGDVTVQVAPPFPPNIQAIAVDSILCLGQSGQLIADLGSLIPMSCGINANCIGASTQVTVGNGIATNTISSYPSILGNAFSGAKHQYLYSAADLNAAGITGGNISGLAFFIVGTPNQTNFQQFEVKIGCGNISNLTFFQTGLTTVVTAQSISASAGWNQFNFSQGYDYDGSSDLIVEFCFNNLSFTPNGNAQIRYTNTAYTSEIHNSGFGQNVCSNIWPSAQPSTSRVNLRFNVCSGFNPLAYTYQWNPGTLLNNTTTQTPTWSPTATGNYNYTIIIQDTSGVCVDTTDTLPLEVVTSFDATITTQSPYCVSDLMDTLTSATVGGSWQGPGITDTTNGYFDPATVGVGTYIISYAFGGGCAGSDTALIVVASPPNTNITTPGPFCMRDNPVQMLGTVSGGTWGGTPAIHPTTGIFDPSLAGAGTVNITYTVDSVCDATGTHPITILSALDPSIGTNLGYCINALSTNLVLAAGADPGGVWMGTGITNSVTGTFDPAIAGVGAHTVYYEHPGDCGGPDSAIINVFPLPTAAITGVLPEYCDNIATLVTPSGGTGGGVWSGFSVNPTTGAFVPSSLSPNASPYTITYTVIDANNCSAIDNFDFDVFPSPPPPSPVSTSQPYCQGELIDDLQATVTGNNTVQWYSDDLLTNLLATGIDYNAGTAIGDFTLYLTQTAPGAQGGCASNVLPLNIQVINSPSPSFTANPNTGAAPLLVNFTNTTSPVSNFTYDWDFKNGNFSTETSPNETFTSLNTYPVTLTATDAFGCVGTVVVNVVVEVNINTFIPNIFTPNGDGQNDVFKVDFIEGEAAVQSFEGLIFNRWGRKVAELNEPSAEWDGGNQEDGVYYYVVNITSVDGTLYKLNGHITLLRSSR